MRHTHQRLASHQYKLYYKKLLKKVYIYIKWMWKRPIWTLWSIRRYTCSSPQATNKPIAMARSSVATSRSLFIASNKVAKIGIIHSPTSWNLKDSSQRSLRLHSFWQQRWQENHPILGGRHHLRHQPSYDITIKETLSKNFKMDDRGELKWFLRIDMGQKRYAQAILRRFNMSECKPAPSPVIHRNTSFHTDKWLGVSCT